MSNKTQNQVWYMRALQVADSNDKTEGLYHAGITNGYQWGKEDYQKALVNAIDKKFADHGYRVGKKEYLSMSVEQFKRLLLETNPLKQ